MNVGFHPAAGSELQAAANYYESRVPGLGGDFLIEIEAACSRLSELPLEGSHNAGVEGSIPSLSTIGLLVRSAIPRKVGVEVLREAPKIRLAAATSRPISGAL